MYAGEAPGEEELTNSTQEILDVGEEPPELDKMIVTDRQFILDQETALRMVQQALDRHKSEKREDKDVWVCWYRKPAGTHRTYMEYFCNGDLWALRPDPNSVGLLASSSPIAAG